MINDPPPMPINVPRVLFGIFLLIFSIGMITWILTTFKIVLYAVLIYAALRVLLRIAEKGWEFVMGDSGGD